MFPAMSKRKDFASPSPLSPLDEPETRKKHEEYLKEHKQRLQQLEYEASEHFLESPPPWPKN